MEKFKQLSIFKKIVVIGIVVFIAFFVLPFMSWLIGEESFTATSSADFCVGCHSMEPFVLSNADSAHGGNNDYGIKASCTTCHLPHDNSAIYLYEKARTGVHDISVETFGNPEEIDWLAKTEHREEFVYDSGCLTCHVELEAATKDQEQHTRYFSGETTSKCVTCHEEIGHSNVKKHLLQHKYK